MERNRYETYTLPILSVRDYNDKGKGKSICLGSRLNGAGRSADLHRSSLRKKIGVSIETISSIERGIKMPRLQNFVAIANQLGVSADELLQDELDFGFIAEANALSKSWRSCRGQIGSGF